MAENGAERQGGLRGGESEGQIEEGVFYVAENRFSIRTTLGGLGLGSRVCSLAVPLI